MKSELTSSPAASTIIITALISESVLLIAALIWIWLRDLEFVLNFSSLNILQGIKASGPLIAFNFGVFTILSKNPRYSIYRKFLREIVLPVAAPLNAFTAIIIALCSGVAEEIFFRAALNVELSNLIGQTVGIAIGAFIFAYIHFWSLAKQYWQIVLFYWLFGLYFSFLAIEPENLSVAIVCHCFYNYVALIYLRYVEKFAI